MKIKVKKEYTKSQFNIETGTGHNVRKLTSLFRQIVQLLLSNYQKWHLSAMSKDRRVSSYYLNIIK